MYTPYFGKFPLVQYDIEKGKYKNYDTVTNVFFRLGMLKNALSNSTSYYVLELEDGDTPEGLAEKVYGDSGAAWIVLYANNIIDPQYEWPLDHQAFDRYLIEKYRNNATHAKIDTVTINNGGSGYSNGYVRFSGGSGSQANASVSVNANGSITNIIVTNSGNFYRLQDDVTANVTLLGGTSANLSVNLSITDEEIIRYTKTHGHHFEKNVEKFDEASGKSTITTFIINEFKYIDTDLPYEYYDPLSVTLGITADSTRFTADNVDYNADYTIREDFTTGGGSESEVGANLEADTYLYSGSLSRTERREVVRVGGKTIVIISSGRKVTIFDHETKINDDRRLIKVVKKDYYDQIINEFNNLTNQGRSLTRRLI
jgi:hypothetical protein